jgi:hypothetical protein
MLNLTRYKGHAIAQVVSCRFLTGAAQVRSQVRSGHVEFVVDNVALGQVFSKYFDFSANLHSTDCSTLIIIYHPGLAQ